MQFFKDMSIILLCLQIFLVCYLQDALRDLHRAEKAGYPTSLQHKILARRVKCHTALGHLEQAKEMLQNLKNMQHPPNIRGREMNEICQGRETCRKNIRLVLLI